MYAPLKCGLHDVRRFATNHLAELAQLREQLQTLRASTIEEAAQGVDASDAAPPMAAAAAASAGREQGACAGGSACSPRPSRDAHAPGPGAAANTDKENRLAAVAPLPGGHARSPGGGAAAHAASPAAVPAGAASPGQRLQELRRLLKERAQLLSTGLYGPKDDVIAAIDARMQQLADAAE